MKALHGTNKPSNYSLAERIIRLAPGISRAELAALLDVSLATVNSVVSQGIERKKLIEQFGARANGTVGRPSSGLLYAGDKSSFGLVTWTHGVLRTAIVSFDGEVHDIDEELVERSAAVPASGDILRLVSALMEVRLAGIERPRVIVLSVPAPYEHGLASDVRFRDRFSPQAIGRWFENDPAPTISAALGIPVIIENDSNLAGLGESRSGAGRDATLMIYVRLSDRGIGSGFILEGQPVEGADGLAGELSHARVDQTLTTICSCGSRGCLRMLLGPALLSPLRSTYGDDLTYAQLIQLAEDGEPGPMRVLQDAGRNIGVPLAHVITFLNPNVVVVEGGSMRASEVVISGISEYLGQSTAPFIRNSLDIRPGALGPQAIDVGAIEHARADAIGVPEIARRFRQLSGWNVPMTLPHSASRRIS